MSERPPPILLPPREAAHRLGVSTRTLSRWVEAGLIPSIVLPSGHRRFTAKDVAEVVERGRVRA